MKPDVDTARNDPKTTEPGAPEATPEATGTPDESARAAPTPAVPELERPTTPAQAPLVPTPDAEGRHDLERPEYFLNRELTWLNFNFRVLHEAEDERTPLLERFFFLGIVGSNIDEFFMKRIGGLKQQVG